MTWFGLNCPIGFTPASTQTIDIDRFATGRHLLPGDRLYIVGFPHGYSAYGDAEPTPITLVRNLASAGNAEFFNESLLDAACAPAMSGAPVFADLEQEMKVVGIYVGSVYTDRGNGNVRQFALGRMAPFHMLANAPLGPSRVGASSGAR